MVDGDTPKDAIRSQIRLIAREVAALEADYASLAQAHSELQSGLEERISKFQERDKQAMREWFDEQNKKAAEIRKRHTLHYNS
jgi:prefoldin subunit 5